MTFGFLFGGLLNPQFAKTGMFVGFIAAMTRLSSQDVDRVLTIPIGVKPIQFAPEKYQPNPIDQKLEMIAKMSYFARK
jgi:hypothetical protein